MVADLEKKSFSKVDLSSRLAHLLENKHPDQAVWGKIRAHTEKNLLPSLGEMRHRSKGPLPPREGRTLILVNG